MKTLAKKLCVTIIVAWLFAQSACAQVCQNGECVTPTKWKTYAEQATVKVTCSRFGGSGVVVFNGSDGTGLVLTNAHVVAGHTEATIEFLRGGTTKASVKQIDDVADLAMLMFDSSKAPRHVGSAPISPIEPAIGDKVVAVGYEYGNLVVKSGNIVSKREMVPPKMWSSWVASFDAKPGLSGSPVFSSQTGDIIGIVWGGTGNSASIVALGEVKRFVYKKCDWLFGRQQPKPEDKIDWIRLKSEIEELKLKIAQIGTSDTNVSDRIKSIEEQVNKKIEIAEEEQRERLARIDARLEMAEKAASGLAATVGATTGPIGTVFGAIALMLALSRRYIAWKAGVRENQQTNADNMKRELLEVLSQVIKK